MTCFSYEFSDCPQDEQAKESSGYHEQMQCADPQCTDKRFGHRRPIHHSTASNGIITPSSSRTNSPPRRQSFMSPEAIASCSAGSLSASSTSSLGSSPSGSWYDVSSGSTAPSSRRPSVMYPHSSNSYLQEVSPVPGLRSERLTESLNIDQYSFTEARSNDAIGYLDPSSFNSTGFLMPVDDYSQRATSFMPLQESAFVGFPEYEPPTSASMCLSVDLVPNYAGSLVPQPESCSQAEFQSHQPGSFKDDIEPQGIMPSQTTLLSNSMVSVEPIQLSRQPSKDDVHVIEMDEHSLTTIRRYHRRLRKENKKQSDKQSGAHIQDDEYSVRGAKGNLCPHAGESAGCRHPWVRPEHLKRHMAAKHSEQPKKFPCKFKCCQNKKTKEPKIIMTRADNHKAHYEKTHFSYGHGEKTGKNKRKSMKQSMKKGLRDKDYRWRLMLAGQLKIYQNDRKVDPKVKEPLNAWKMIGYSIKETLELRVKDLVPEWQGDDDTRLADLDPRVIALRNGTLTYEQAMSVGQNMKQTSAQGVLGVTMAETREMGIEESEPRWKHLKSGYMSAEDADMLGVKKEWAAVQVRRKR